MIASLFRPSPARAARSLYEGVLVAARRPDLYRDAGVPDTLDGRFEMICLHAHLLMRRLKREGEAAQRLSQALFDAMFRDLELDLRELGASDLKVGDRVKEMARGFYGRIAAYDAGLDGDDAALQAALGRNLFGTVPADVLPPAGPALVAAYMREAVAALDSQSFAELSAGRVRFPN